MFKFVNENNKHNQLDICQKCLLKELIKIGDKAKTILMVDKL